MTPLDAAFVAALEAAGPARTGSPVTVGAPEDPIVHALRAAGGRVVVAPGGGSRLLVGAGVALAGVPGLVLADGGTILPRSVGDGQVAIVRHAPGAELLRRGGWTVAQPVWPDDVAPLLSAALVLGRPTVLRLHDRDVADPPVPPPRAELGVPRILTDGEAGVIVASGALAAVLEDLARLLAKRDHPVTAMDVHTRSGRGRPDLASTDRTLLVGGADAVHAAASGTLRLAQLVPVSAQADVARVVDVICESLSAS